MTNLNLEIRIPFAEDYIKELGLAVYCFSYYESTIIDILSLLDSTFRQRYYRELALTSGQLKKEFEKIKNLHPNKIDLDDCYNDFDSIIDARNRLMHAHPVTDSNEGQILNYQADINKITPDFKWTRANIKSFIEEVNNLTVNASNLLETLR